MASGESGAVLSSADGHPREHRTSNVEHRTSNEEEESQALGVRGLAPARADGACSVGGGAAKARATVRASAPSPSSPRRRGLKAVTSHRSPSEDSSTRGGTPLWFNVECSMFAFAIVTCKDPMAVYLTRMPRKIRQLIADLQRAGFIDRGGKGSHRNYEHLASGTNVTLSGRSGVDAKVYQEKAVKQAIEKVTRK